MYVPSVGLDLGKSPLTSEQCVTKADWNQSCGIQNARCSEAAVKIVDPPWQKRPLPLFGERGMRMTFQSNTPNSHRWCFAMEIIATTT